MFQACMKPERPSTPNSSERTIEDLNIPEEFSFETTQEVRLIITDAQDYVKYSVYSMTEAGEPEVVIEDNDTIVVVDNSNQLIANGVTRNGQWEVVLSLPAHQKFLYVKRFHNGTSFGQRIQIEGTEAYYNHLGNKSFSVVDEDFLFATTDQKQYISIDPQSGDYEVLGNMSDNAYACAVDKANNRLYVAYKSGKKDLGYFDLNTGSYTFIGQLRKTMYRMDYNASEGLLYMGSGKWLYSYDPFSAQYVSSYKLSGQNANKSFGDIFFDAEGVLYLANQIAVFTVELGGNNSPITPVSSSLPFRTQSLVMDSDEKLWLTDHKKPATIYSMSPSNGDYSLEFTGLPFKIYDFGIMLKDEGPQIVDTDGDGVADDQDQYPNDPDRAFDNWVPGENMWGTLAFEDLWPAKGDYDFNDLVLSYKFHQVTNSDNNVVAVEGFFEVKHIGAYYVNGFGFEMPVDASTVSSVTGYNLTNDAFSLASNGIEDGQANAVAVLFDNANANLNQAMTLTVNFSTPVNQAALGAAPYNPFIVVNQQRAYEVHLTDQAPTDLADLELLGSLDDESDVNENSYYRTDINLPWAINIPVEFVWPLEKQPINKGYLRFAEWAESGGTLYSDWYKDFDGYRDETFLSVQN